MVQVALDRGNLKNLVEAMLKAGKLRGPVSGPRGVVLGDISNASELNLGYRNFKLPPKREFFPQCEVIGGYDSHGVSQTTMTHEKTVIFGIRPCDAQALGYLDKVFIDERFRDPYYRDRRDNAIIISLACEKPASTCFCSSAGGGPAGKAGADILAFDLGASLLLESVSEKGEAFIANNNQVFRDATPQESEMRAQQERVSSGRIAEIPVSDVPEILQKELDSSFWDSVAESCLSCGACTYLCPTCHCFDLFDDSRGTAGRKLRVHDACMFSAFTREASGHNPRSKPGERMRQRVMHKFAYTPENFGDVFCVGCGRCISNCPGNIDIRETLSRVHL